MKLSVHNPIRGGFDYYEAPDTVPINDDHATPELSKFRTKIGVPATLAGRPLPKIARKVGHGDVPVGSVSSGNVGSWSSKLAAAIPSGIGLGLFEGIPCPNGQEGALLGAVVGTVVHMGSGKNDKGTVRGLTFVAVGGLLGYLASKYACGRG